MRFIMIGDETHDQVLHARHDEGHQHPEIAMAPEMACLVRSRQQ
jgi:hypothetical protein